MAKKFGKKTSVSKSYRKPAGLKPGASFKYKGRRK